MNDALLVRRFQRLGNLSGDRQRLVDRNRAGRDAIGERRAFDQFHHQRPSAVRLFQSVDLCDVWDD